MRRRLPNERPVLNYLRWLDYPVMQHEPVSKYPELILHLMSHLDSPVYAIVSE